MKRATLLILALLALPLAAGVQITSVDVTPTDAKTTDTLECTVTATGNGPLTANITWYVDDTPHTTDNETLSLQNDTANTTGEAGDIESGDTSKDEDWTCQATVTNGTTTNTTNSSALTIQNSAPTVTYPTTKQTATEDQAFGPIVATANDPDGDPITTWISSDQNESTYGKELFEIQSDGTISFTPDKDEIGNHTMALLASDGELFGGRNVEFEVLSYNDAPALDTLNDQTADEGVYWEYVISASDEENDAINFTIESPLEELQITKTSATQATINFTTGEPKYKHGGTHTINVTVYENGTTSKNDTDSFTLTVNTENRVPSLGPIVYQNATQGNTFNLTINASDPDTNDTLNFTWIANCPYTDPWTLTTTNQSNENATAEINEPTLTNDHIACRNLTITVRDHKDGSPKDSNSTTVVLNLTNTNDDPTVHENSTDSRNTDGQQNMSNLTAPEDLAFEYWVNATDPDARTYEGETLTYTDNTTLFTINATTGRIRFTPNGSQAGAYDINITATDDDGANHSRTMTLTIAANTFPTLVQEPNLSCDEDTNCSALLEASDPDAGENLTYTVTPIDHTTASNSTVNPNMTVAYNTTNTSTAYKTYTNKMVGNYTYNITVADQYGATDSQAWTVRVNNTNDDPCFDNGRDGVCDTINWNGIVVEGYEEVRLINATDDDFENTAENLTLTTNITGPNTTLFTPTKLARNQWEVRFTPNGDADGDYTVNFTVADDEGANDSQLVQFSIYNQSIAPDITEVQPYTNETTGATVENKTNATPLNGSEEVTFSEASTHTLNITWTDADTAPENVTIKWYKDGKSLANKTGTQDPAISETYDYFDAGTYNYTVVVADNRFENDTFSWTVTVQDVNRPPQALENLTDRTINQTTTIQEYMDLFYDPDDDLDSNGTIDGNETNSLAFTHSDTTLLTITFTGLDTTLAPEADGTATITYTATDSEGLNATSNNVTYNVTAEEEETTTTTSSSGGGGGSSAPVPVPQDDDEEPVGIELLAPKPLTIYYNETIAAPITVKNPSDRTLRDVTLSADAASDDAKTSFSRSSFEQLVPGQNQSVDLYVTNYRSGGTYEIVVKAQAQDPDVNDTAILYVNSLEQSSDGESVQTKVTFAQDLVSANPECVELNELIGQAQRAIETGQTGEADKLLNAVVDGCRYLVKQGGEREEVPSGFDLGWLNNYRYANVVLAGLLILLLGVTLMLFLHYHSASKEE